MEENLEEIKKILRTPIALRNSKMIGLLISLTKEISFFKSLISELGEKMHYRICEFLNLEHREADSVTSNQVLFKEGDRGESFYILLNGKVKLLISKRGTDDKTLTEIAQLASGQSFGELSLIKNQPRTATVICMESCYFMTLSKENYLRLLGKSFATMLEEKIEFLHSLPVFATWTKKSLEKLSYFFIPKSFKQNQIIYLTGEASLQVFIIIKGQVELTTSNLAGNNLPKTLKVAVISDKDFLGDEEVLLGVTRKYSARCLSRTSVFYIASQDFLSKIDKESLKSLRKTNVLRDSLRTSRLDCVRSLSQNENKSASPDSAKKAKLTIAPSLTKKKMTCSPSKNLAFSPVTIKRIEKRSLANLHSPTVSIIQNAPVTHRPKSVNVFINVKGFQPNNLPPAGIFRRIQNRIKVKKTPSSLAVSPKFEDFLKTSTEAATSQQQESSRRFF